MNLEGAVRRAYSRRAFLLGAVSGAAVALLYALRLAMVDNGKFVGLSKTEAGRVHFFDNYETRLGETRP